MHSRVSSTWRVQASSARIPGVITSPKYDSQPFPRVKHSHFGILEYMRNYWYSGEMNVRGGNL